jgi:signal peptidase I
MSLRPPSSSEPAEAHDDHPPQPAEPPKPVAVPDGEATADPNTHAGAGADPATGVEPGTDPTTPDAGVEAGTPAPGRPATEPGGPKGIGPDGGFAAGPATKGGLATASPASSVPGDAARHRGKGKGPLSFLRELPALIIIAFLLALLIKSFLVQAFYIPSGSMEPTLDIGDRVLVNKLAYKFNPPSRGDVIVFSNPNPGVQPHRNVFSAFFHWVTEGLGFSAPQDEDFIKRVIGLPGETVEERGGVIYIDGKPLDEPYLSPIKDTRAYGPVRVKADHLIVLGDNRTNSNDSRFDLGQIPIDKVIGKAFIKIWPPGHFGGLADGTQFAPGSPTPAASRSP